MAEENASKWASFFAEELGCWIYDPQRPVIESLSPKLLEEAKNIPGLDPHEMLESLRSELTKIKLDELPNPTVPMYFTLVGDINFTMIVDEVGTYWITDQGVEDLEMHGLVNLGATRVGGNKTANLH